MTLHYKSCGLNFVWLKSGYNAHETRYGTSYSYEDIDGLYRAITMELCDSQREINPEILRFLRKRLGYSQGELGAELGYTSQAVAKWEKGTSNIPVAVARLVRLLCLHKFSPNKPLHAALREGRAPSMGRIEFEYTSSIWQVIGVREIERNVQISNSTYINFIKYVSNDPRSLLKYSSLTQRPDELPSSIPETIYDESIIPQDTSRISTYQAVRTVKTGIYEIYKTQNTNQNSDADSASATTIKNFKLELDTITHGTC